MKKKSRLEKYIDKNYVAETILIKKGSKWNEHASYATICEYKEKIYRLLLSEKMMQMSDAENRIYCIEDNRSESLWDVDPVGSITFSLLDTIETERYLCTLATEEQHSKYSDQIFKIKDAIAKRQMKQDEYEHLLNTGEQALFEEFCNKLGIERRLE